MKHRYTVRKAGFTLLEIMVALAIIATVFLSIFKMHTQTVSMTASTQFNAIAPILTNDRLAEILLQLPDELSDDSGDFGDAHAGYNWKITVQDVESEDLGTELWSY